MTARDLRRIEKDGWYWVRTRGSHHQYKHPEKPGLVTVPGNPGNKLAAGMLNNILKQDGLKQEGYEVPEPSSYSSYIDVAASFAKRLIEQVH